MGAQPVSTPNYRLLSETAFDARVRALWRRYEDCDLCPHQCGVDRTDGETGACGVEDAALVASYFDHHGEESVLRGHSGSGTIFLAGCNMHCVFCQNFEISQERQGDPASPQEIAEMALELQNQGCHNVNFVTPTHTVPHLVEAVRIARDHGLKIPIVWNCGGYERADIVESLEGIVDIYMPDIKWSDGDAAAKYSRAPDYWDHARDALREMHRQVGNLSADCRDIATEGLLVRHLVMPGHVENSKGVLKFLAEEISRDTYVNVMNQYRPHYQARTDPRYEAINRPVSGEEYHAVVEYAQELGLRLA